MTEQFSRQCTLTRKMPGGTMHTVSWIPEQFAKKGKFLKLKDGDCWTDGWEVTGVGSRKTSKEVSEHSRPPDLSKDDRVLNEDRKKRQQK